jgi:hypothetical protein
VSLFENVEKEAQKILHFPKTYLPLCNEAAQLAQQELCETNQTVKTKV